MIPRAFLFITADRLPRAVFPSTAKQAAEIQGFQRLALFLALAAKTFSGACSTSLRIAHLPFPFILLPSKTKLLSGERQANAPSAEFLV